MCVPPESFLLVLYNPMHSKPEFYEVVTSTGSGQMNFDLFNGYEVINLPKVSSNLNIFVIGFLSLLVISPSFIYTNKSQSDVVYVSSSTKLEKTILN